MCCTRSRYLGSPGRQRPEQLGMQLRAHGPGHPAVSYVWAGAQPGVLLHSGLDTQLREAASPLCLPSSSMTPVGSSLLLVSRQCTGDRAPMCGLTAAQLSAPRRCRTLSTNPERNLSALWGILAAHILTLSWEAALEDLMKLKDIIDSNSFTPVLTQLQQRTWLMHWALFVFFNHDNGRNAIIDLFLQERCVDAPQATRLRQGAVRVFSWGAAPASPALWGRSLHRPTPLLAANLPTPASASMLWCVPHALPCIASPTAWPAGSDISWQLQSCQRHEAQHLAARCADAALRAPPPPRAERGTARPGTSTPCRPRRRICCATWQPPSWSTSGGGAP